MPVHVRWTEKVLDHFRHTNGRAMNAAWKLRPFCASCRLGRVMKDHRAADGSPVYGTLCAPCTDLVEGSDVRASDVGGIRMDMARAGVPLRKGLL